MARLSDSVAPLVKMISRGVAPIRSAICLRALSTACFGFPAELVIAAGGVAEVLGEVGQHRVENARVHPRGGVIIEINGRLHFFELPDAGWPYTTGFSGTGRRRQLREPYRGRFRQIRDGEIIEQSRIASCTLRSGSRTVQLSD
jgi:hypothetical protein